MTAALVALLMVVLVLNKSLIPVVADIASYYSPDEDSKVFHDFHAAYKVKIRLSLVESVFANQTSAKATHTFESDRGRRRVSSDVAG